MKNKVLVQSVLISLAFHAAAATVLFSKQLSFHPNFLTQIGRSPSFLEQEELAFLKKNEALEEALSRFERKAASKKREEMAVQPQFERPSPFPQIPLAFPNKAEEAVIPEIVEKALAQGGRDLQKVPSINIAVVEPFKEIARKECDIVQYSLPLPPLKLKEEEKGISWMASREAISDLMQLPLMEDVDVLDLKPSLKVLDFCADVVENHFSSDRHLWIRPDCLPSITHRSQTLSFRDYGLPALHLKDWGSLFDVDIKTFPHEEKGFLFTVSLIPKQDLSEHRLKQNYLFIIDRSNSIDKNQYQSFKKAVGRAICALREGDFFNVVLLDAKATLLSPKPLSFSKASQKLAEAFLEKQSQGHHGAATDIYSTLMGIGQFAEDAQEATTAILISDGDSPLKQSRQRRKIQEWALANQDRVVLYTAAAGHGNNLSSLKMMGLSSRGSLLYSDTHAAFPRKLARLVMDLRYPIAKEMTVSWQASDPHAELELLPPSHRLPYLFADRPFVFVGSAVSLADFTLVLEGKNRDQDLVIRKTISLSKGKPASRLLIKQWAAEKANALIELYLQEGDTALLQKAEKQLGYHAQDSRR